MKRLLMAFLAATVATPANAQQSMPGMEMPAPKAKSKPVAKAPLKKAPAKAPVGTVAKAKTPAKTTTKKEGPSPAAKPSPKEAPEVPPPMAGHNMPVTSAPALAPPPAGNLPVPAHAGDAMIPTDMGPMEAVPEPSIGAPPPAASSGPVHAADAIYGTREMAEAREKERAGTGGTPTFRVMVDQLETQIRNGRDGYYWEAFAWYGGDINKLWISTEGEGPVGKSPESAEIQILYSRALDPWFNFQVGVRQDFRPNPKRTHLVLGFAGFAPYMVDVTGALFLSNKGDLTARFEAEYDLRLTQSLILQPRLDLNFAAQNIPEIGVGAGLSNVEAGLRLRYQFVPEFAPYIGVGYNRAFGRTADYARAANEDIGGWTFLTGLRVWF